MGNFWGKKRAVTLGYGGKDAEVVFDEKYFIESIRKPMDKVAKESSAPMPPPPAVNDEEMKALVAYVRALSDGSAEMDADEGGLIAKGKIENFSFAAYKGSWNKLPDFSKLKPFKTARRRAARPIPASLKFRKTSAWCSRDKLPSRKRAITNSSLGRTTDRSSTSTTRLLWTTTAYTR